MKKILWRFKTKNGALYGLTLQGRFRYYWHKYQEMKTGKMTMWNHFRRWRYMQWWRKRNLRK